jgi:signal transduction histidine kinase/phage shock protein PspC (stress-responsive transcriptional regulator)
VQATVDHPIVPPTRPALVRPLRGRVLGGVAAGLAAHLGLPVRTVRIALVLSCLVNGFGLILYLWLWALVPTAESVLPGPAAPGMSPGRSSGRGDEPVPREVDPQESVRQWANSRWGLVVAGLGLLLVAVILYAWWRGLALPVRHVLPPVIMIAGALLAYSQLDQIERNQWITGPRTGGRIALVRVVGGLGLVLLGMQVLLFQQVDLTTAGRMMLSGVAVVLGAGIVLAPWVVRLWRWLDEERSARVREAERADIAAHLHDSVLQTLALIQRRSEDPITVARLARAQERELRDWLYGTPAGEGTLAALVRQMAAETEDVHGAAIEVVTVGDRDLDESTSALSWALREALVNAARHAGGTVQVYLECGPDRVEAFVRDRGPGFDPSTVAADRHGLRESVIARMERHGGSAQVLSAPGSGTEVRLRLPSGQEEKA